MEVSQLDLKDQQTNFQDKEEEPEQKALKEDDWICESCNATNTMTNDLKSAICVKCKKKNEVIEYMVSQKSGASADAKA